jgi:uncharacterized protein YggE
MKYLSAFILLSVTFVLSANTSLPNNRHIAVVGNAQLMAKPDTALVHLAVESQQTTSAMAKKEVDDRVNNLLNGLAQFGVDEENVSASSISTAPYYSYGDNGKRQLEGFKANRTLKVTLNNIEQLNLFMDFALTVKINEIQNIELKSSRATELEDEVKAMAVKDATETGSSLAKAFGATLGKIYSINSSSNQERDRFGSNDKLERITVTGSAMSAPSQPGQYLQENIVFSASISVVFDLTVE